MFFLRNSMFFLPLNGRSERDSFLQEATASRLRAQGSRLEAQGSGFQDQGSGFNGSRLKAQNLELKAQGSKIWGRRLRIPRNACEEACLNMDTRDMSAWRTWPGAEESRCARNTPLPRTRSRTLQVST